MGMEGDGSAREVARGSMTDSEELESRVPQDGHDSLFRPGTNSPQPGHFILFLSIRSASIIVGARSLPPSITRKRGAFLRTPGADSGGSSKTPAYSR